MITYLFLVLLIDNIGTHAVFASITQFIRFLIWILTVVFNYCDSFSIWFTRCAVAALFASCYYSASFLTLHLLFLDFHHTIVFDPFDFLTHSEEFDHLFGINSSCNELSYWHLILLVQCGVHVVITIQFWSLLFQKGSILFLLFVVSFSEFRVDNSQG